ncbi:membrane protein [Lactobacillus phage LBR48]|uniref:Putative membrane protein n=1 Tax=Lactobacillus phage LBR48 TaxID=755164 RepID=D6PSS5_9CAUD|nr:membrane protein [Lactobacillus phage LBR48]ADF83416.1 putative membrane protein [Lactobacillus phage LBR48]
MGKRFPQLLHSANSVATLKVLIPNTQKNVDQTSNYQQTASPDSFTSNISDVPYNENKIPGIVSSTKLYFKDMFRINKRMGRADFWWASLGVGIIMVIIGFIIGIIQTVFLGGSDNFMETDIAGELTPAGVTSLIMLIILLAIYVILFIAALTGEIRRLHDLGYNGAFWLINLVPAIGSLIMLIILCQPSKQQNNRYAPQKIVLTASVW